jgi:outer membrane lipoprotein SlyB
MKKNLLMIGAAMLALVGCSTAPYDRSATDTSRVEDSAMRYGSIAALAAGGAAAGYQLGNKNVGTAIGGGLLGGGLAYAFNKFMDGKRQSAYDAGIDDGAKALAAQILKDKWTREAVYGVGKEDERKEPVIRQVYVPTRDVNGVVLDGGYQQVQYYK